MSKQRFKYTFHLHHDKGKAQITLISTSLEKAIGTICDIESCPERAIYKTVIRRLPEID